MLQQAPGGGAMTCHLREVTITDRSIIFFRRTGLSWRIAMTMISFILAAATAFSPSPSTAVPRVVAQRAYTVLAIKEYTRIGDVPDGINWGPATLAEVVAMIDERAACRASKDFERADALKEQLRRMGGDVWGIKVRDAERTWYVSRQTAQSVQRSTLVVRQAPKGASKALYEEGKAVVRRREERLAMLHARAKAEKPTSPSPVVDNTRAEAPGDAEKASAAAVDPSAVAAVAPAPAGFDWGATF